MTFIWGINYLEKASPPPLHNSPAWVLFDQICLLQYKFPLSLFHLNMKSVYSPNLWVLQLSWNLQRATVRNVLMQCFMQEHLRVSSRLPVSWQWCAENTTLCCKSPKKLWNLKGRVLSIETWNDLKRFETSYWTRGLLNFLLTCKWLKMFFSKHDDDE